MRRQLGPLVAAALVALAILPASSEGDAIGRANLNGSGVNQNFIAGIGYPVGVAVDAGHVYWADLDTDTIGRANLDGSNARQDLITRTGSFDVAVDAHHVYWANYREGTIGRANLDGSNAKRNFITGASQPAGVAVDAHHVYWGNYAGGAIGRANLDGSNAKQDFITGADAPAGVAVDSGHVYWANSFPDTIGRANLDGSNARQDFITGASYVQDVAVDSGHVYWANEGRGNNGDGNNTGTIGRANLNGHGANQRFITNGTRLARGVAVDSHHVYWTHSPPPNTTVYAGPSGVTNDPTPSFAFYSSDGGSSFECKLDGGAYSACASPKTMGHLADGPHTFYVRAKDAAGNLDPTPASRSFTVRTAEVHILGSTLVVKAATGAKDDLRVSRPSASDLLVTDSPGGPYTGSGVHAWGGCTRIGDRAAHCDAAGIRVIQVSSGNQTDKVVNSTAVGSWLSGGTANDRLIGGSNKDTLLGGPGADVMNGMNGDDLLRGQDLTDDTTINCDGGTAPGGADKAVLDPLPDDSPASGCETVIRH